MKKTNYKIAVSCECLNRKKTDTKHNFWKKIFD